LLRTTSEVVGAYGGPSLFKMSKAIPLGLELIENPHDVHEILFLHRLLHDENQYELYRVRYQDLKLGNSVSLFTWY